MPNRKKARRVPPPEPCDCCAAEVEQSSLGDHCCQQYADLSGLTVDEVKRVGSCGCVQAKAERDEWERVAMLRRDELTTAHMEIERIKQERCAYTASTEDALAKALAEVERLTRERDSLRARIEAREY